MSKNPVQQNGAYLLAVDTCGPSGSVAIGRSNGDVVDILGEKELEGRSYSATLVMAVRELLGHIPVRDLQGIVVVNGPGSFTGVRIGLSVVKGLLDAAPMPVATLSRLEVLAWKAHTQAAALDAHRNEVFLKTETTELLAGNIELLEVFPPPKRLAVCDAAAAKLLQAAWPTSEFVQVQAPMASDALQIGWRRLVVGDSAQLDGHYLRRSDAEIFGT